MTDAAYQARTEQRIDSLMELLEEQQAEIKALQEQLALQGDRQNLDLLIDSVATMAVVYRPRYETLPNTTQNVIKAYDRYITSQQELQTSSL